MFKLLNVKLFQDSCVVHTFFSLKVKRHLRKWFCHLWYVENKPKGNAVKITVQGEVLKFLEDQVEQHGGKGQEARLR